MVIAVTIAVTAAMRAAITIADIASTTEAIAVTTVVIIATKAKR